MGNGRFKRRFYFCPFRICVDPLVITGNFGKLVDAVLVYGVPLTQERLFSKCTLKGSVSVFRGKGYYRIYFVFMSIIVKRIKAGDPGIVKGVGYPIVQQI